LDHSSYGYGYNAQMGEYGNLASQGVIDPTKAARRRTQPSIAGLLITTESNGRRTAKERSGPPPMPGGMAGMEY